MNTSLTSSKMPPNFERPEDEIDWSDSSLGPASTTNIPQVASQAQTLSSFAAAPPQIASAPPAPPIQHNHNVGKASFQERLLQRQSQLLAEKTEVEAERDKYRQLWQQECAARISDQTLVQSLKAEVARLRQREVQLLQYTKGKHSGGGGDAGGLPY
jgi:hypothetical protein